MRLKLFLAYLLILVALPAHAWMGPVMCGGGVAAAGGVCTIGASPAWANADHTDYWNGSTTEDYNFQEVANSTSKNICKITAWYKTPGLDSTITLKLKSGVGGTVYGTSDSQMIIGDDVARELTFTFSPAVTVTSDFIVSVLTDNIVNIMIAYTTDRDQYFGGTSYKGTYSNTERNEDMAMAIYYEQ